MDVLIFIAEVMFYGYLVIMTGVIVSRIVGRMQDD